MGGKVPLYESDEIVQDCWGMFPLCLARNSWEKMRPSIFLSCNYLQATPIPQKIMKSPCKFIFAAVILSYPDILTKKHLEHFKVCVPLN